MKKIYLRSIKIKKLESLYNKELLIFNLNNYVKLQDKKRKVNIKYIKKIFNYFKPILNDDYIIFFHGSYSKDLTRWNSDIDLNMLSLNNSCNNDFVVEELLFSIMYKVLGYKGRDKIHTMMIYLKETIKEDNTIYSEKSNIIFSNNYKYHYSYRNNYKDVFFKLKNSSRSFSSFKNYILSYMGTNEWEYSFKMLNHKNKNQLVDLLNTKDLLISEELFFSNLEKYYDKYLIQEEKFSDIKTVDNFNKLIKINNLKSIYMLLLCLKQFIIIKKGKCLGLNIKKIFKNKTLKKYIDKKDLKQLNYYIYNYIWFLDKVENLCNKLNINFSSREHSSFNIEKFKRSYYKIYKVTFDADYEVYNKFKLYSKKISERMMNEND